MCLLSWLFHGLQLCHASAACPLATLLLTVPPPTPPSVPQNIHNARTAKKAVLFVGHKDGGNGRWSFQLNPSLSWADVSPETRRRLQHLPQEAEQAFRRQAPAGGLSLRVGCGGQ